MVKTGQGESGKQKAREPVDEMDKHCKKLQEEKSVGLASFRNGFLGHAETMDFFCFFICL